MKYIAAATIAVTAWEFGRRWYPWFVYKLFSRGDT